MTKLLDVLNVLHQELLELGFESLADLESVSLTMEEILEFGKLGDYSDAEVATLPVAAARWYQTLVYFESLVHLYGTMASDGLMSVFYNDTGREIDRMRTKLLEAKDPAAPVLAAAHELFSHAFELQAEENWVTMHGELSPHDALSAETLERAEAMEARIEALQSESEGHALRLLRDAVAEYRG